MKYKIFLTALLFAIVYYFAPPELLAQSCSGQITCCLNSSTVCTDSAGNNCSPGPGCSCSTVCSDWDVPQNCYLDGGSCRVRNGCGFASGSCTYNPPPPTSPPSTPGPTAPPGGSTCSGSNAECHIGSNCGEIGKVGGSGSCSNGGLCCVDAGAPPVRECRINGKPFAMQQYTVQEITAFVRGISPDMTECRSRWLPGERYIPNARSVQAREPVNLHAFGELGVYSIIYESYNCRGSVTGSPGCTDTTTLTVVPNPSIEIIGIPDPFTVPNSGTVPFTVQVNPVDPSDFTINSIRVGRGNARISTIATPAPPSVSPNVGTTGDLTPYSSDGVNFPSYIYGRSTGSTAVAIVLDVVMGGVSRTLSHYVRGTVVANAAPTVQITYPQPSTTIVVGQTVDITALATDPDYTAGDNISVEFLVDSGAGFVSLGTDNSPLGDCLTGCTCTSPTQWVVPSEGSHTIRAVVTDNGGATGTHQITLNALNPVAWWQVTGGGGVISALGGISTQVPVTFAPPSFPGYLLLPDAISGRPGTAIYGSGTASFGDGEVSDPGWINNSATAANLYTYEHFLALSAGKTFTDLGADPVVDTSTISSASDDGGYSWIRASGNVVISNPGVGVNVNKRAVLFVDGDVAIQSRVNVNDIQNDFFMVIASGDITVDPAVTGTVADPAVTGVFVCNGVFSTGASDQQFVLRGSVAASRVNMERDLLAGNVDTPAEQFIYSPDLVVKFPSSLSQKHLIWREVAP
jgi:hypothetical protein